MRTNKYLTLPAFLLLSTTALAKPKVPVPATAFDGGIISAETVGRGNTVASNQGTPASGSENPAALNTPFTSSLYTSYAVGVTSKVPKKTRRVMDPLGEKVFQYAAIGAEKGVIFYEPISRLDNLTTAQMSVDAIGFAGADNWRNGSLGISLAYLRSSLFQPNTPAALPGEGYDTADGVRFNIGARLPTGPTMWGLVLQNAPGFLWWKHHERTTLPLKIRVGNTWRIRPGILSTVEWEERYYNKGSNKEDYWHFGAETQVTNAITLRAGMFANDVQESKDRHWTGGLTLKTDMNAEVSYAFEQFEIDSEKVTESFLSVSFPFAATETLSREH